MSLRADARSAVALASHTPSTSPLPDFCIPRTAANQHTTGGGILWEDVPEPIQTPWVSYTGHRCPKVDLWQQGIPEDVVRNEVATVRYPSGMKVLPSATKARRRIYRHDYHYVKTAHLDKLFGAPWCEIKDISSASRTSGSTSQPYAQFQRAQQETGTVGGLSSHTIDPNADMRPPGPLIDFRSVFPIDLGRSNVASQPHVAPQLHTNATGKRKLISDDQDTTEQRQDKQRQLMANSITSMWPPATSCNWGRLSYLDLADLDVNNSKKSKRPRIHETGEQPMPQCRPSEEQQHRKSSALSTRPPVPTFDSGSVATPLTANREVGTSTERPPPRLSSPSTTVNSCDKPEGSNAAPSQQPTLKQRLKAINEKIKADHRRRIEEVRQRFNGRSIF